MDECEALRRELERERQAGIEVHRQLEKANAEFERFISVAAHNLREHLRDVTASSQLLGESASARPGSDEEACLQRIEKGAAAMRSILSGVVELWSAGADGEEVSAVDMEAVFCQAVLCSEGPIAGRNAVVTHGPLPCVAGDFETLAKTLQHLLCNAIGYCEDSVPRVHLSANPGAEGYVFSLKDNGPGIEPEFQARIFEPFRRLHGKEHPGNGLGLAFCRRVIEWHGGRIWLESVPGTGSTFYFTLPRA